MNFFTYAVAFIIMGLVLLISSFLAFDRLIGLEYNLHREQWERDGQPLGYFWISPPRGQLFSSFYNQLKRQFARDKLSRKWLLSKPEWTRDDSKAVRLLQIYRLITIAWFIFYGIPLLTILAIGILGSAGIIK